MAFKKDAFYWMKITMDDLELPVAIADTAEELAAMCGTTTNTIYSAVSHANADGTRSSYKRVDRIKEDETDD